MRQSKDQRLRLAYPLTSRSVLAWEVHDLGNATETQLTLESVGRPTRSSAGRQRTEPWNASLRFTQSCLCGARTGSRRLSFLQTFIIDEINDIVEAECLRGEVL
jgi:hypothetical protein